MGACFTKINPDSLATESWSTLDAFITSEKSRGRRDTVAESTITEDKHQIQRVKTRIKISEQKTVPPLQLDDHLISQPKTSSDVTNTTKKDKANETKEMTIIDKTEETDEIKDKTEEKNERKITWAEPEENLEPKKVKRQVTKYICGDEKLDMEIDSLNNLRKEPTDMQIKKQLQRWKTELAMEKKNQTIKMRSGVVKRSDSFFDVRRAMVNRENIMIEHKYTIQSKIPQIPEEDEKTPTTNTPAPTIAGAQETKSYENEENLEYLISREQAPGFDLVIEETEAEKQCKTFVENIQGNVNKASCVDEISKLLQSWKTSSFLKTIEQYILNLPLETVTSVVDLANSLAPPDAAYLQPLTENPVHVQVAKSYAIYYWIAANITFDAELWANYLQIKDLEPSASDILAEHKAICFDYSLLFLQLALLSNLEAVVVNGNVRLWRDYNGDVVTQPHSWNVVKFGDMLFPVDCMFGSGYFTLSSKYIKYYNTCYFAMPPQFSALTHWPTNPSHQLLTSPLTHKDMEDILPVPMYTIAMGIRPLTWSEVLYPTVQLPLVAVKFKVINGSDKISANLVPGPGTWCDDLRQCIYIKKDADIWQVQAVIPTNGYYKLNIFIKPGTSAVTDDQDNMLCLSYTVHCDLLQELKLELGFPKVNEEASSEFNFRLIHWNNPVQSCVCQNLSGLLSMVFEANSGVKFRHCIIPGKVNNLSLDAYHYNTMVISNDVTNSLKLYQLQAIFPTNGWWTVYLSGTTDQAVDNFTPLLIYHIFVTIGLQRNSYPYVLAPYVELNTIKPIATTGEEVLEVMFVSSKYLNFQHYLTTDLSENGYMEGYTKIIFNGKAMKKNCYVYSLKVIFPEPNNWYVHVLGREISQQELAYTKIFKLNIVVTRAWKNTFFVNYKEQMEKGLGILNAADDTITFPDNGQPLTYSFKAPRNANFFHSIKSKPSGTSDRENCTFLYTEGSINDLGSADVDYTLRAIFPSTGKWVVQFFTAKAKSTNYSLIFDITVNVTNPLPNFTYPKINPAFYQLCMNVDADKALVRSVCTDAEFELPFTASDDLAFNWSMEFLATGERTLLNGFIYYNNSERDNRTFRIIFPKAGEWMIRLFSKRTGDLAGKSTNFQSVLELRLQSLEFKSEVCYPQVFEAFYSTFKLRFDKKHLPLVSKVTKFPTRVAVPFYSPATVEFWHDVDVKYDDENMDDSMCLEDQCKMISDPSTGLNKLLVEVTSRGKWTVSVYAKMLDSTSKNWTAVLKHTIHAE